MTRSPRQTHALLAIIAAVCAAVVIYQARACSHARSRSFGAERALERAATDVREVLALRSRAEQASAGRRPDQDIIARVSDTLRRAGMDAGVFRGQMPETDAVLPAASASDPTYRRQAVRVSLAGLAPVQLGEFVSIWRSEQPMWTISRIDLAHRGKGDGGADANRYDATIVVAATYVELADGVPARSDSDSSSDLR